MYQNATKKALLSSVVAVFLCFAMLLGTTFAWFTDSATSSGNKIVTGKLDVELYQWTAADVSTNISDSKDPVYSDNILWEPGMTEVVYLSIKNAGTLALKYKVAIIVTNTSNDELIDVMSYAVQPNVTYGNATAWTGNGTYVPASEKSMHDVGTAQDVALLPGEEHFFALALHMDEEAGNEYMSEEMTFDIKVLAGQYTYEEDSFGSTYDEFAAYPGVGYAPVPTGNQTAASIEVRDDENGHKVGSFLIPADAVDENATQLVGRIEKSDYTNANIQIAAGNTAVAYDVTVEGLKDGNSTPVTVQLRIPAGLDPATVVLYHYGAEANDYTYNPNNGYVTFKSTSFSPFTVVYDPESEYVAPEIPEDENGNMKYPTATVTYAPDYVGEGKVQWGSYGQWSPTPNLDQALEAAFIFAAPDYESATDEEKAVIEAYRNWYCDFFVSLDTDLGANQIFLGGYYASYGAYVGFHNGDLTLDANTELPLLSSVSSNPWTYADVERDVAEFVCGVGDVANALEGATFTVRLRLIDPSKVDTNVDEWWANLSEDAYVDVNVVSHTFGAGSVIDGEEVVLARDMDLNNPEDWEALQGLLGGN